MNYNIIRFFALALLLCSCSNIDEMTKENPFEVKLLKEEEWGDRFQTQLKKADGSFSKIQIVSNYVEDQYYVVPAGSKDTVELDYSYGIKLEDIRVIDSTFLEIKYSVRMGSNVGGSEYVLVTFGNDGSLVKSLAIYYDYKFAIDNYYYPGAPEVDDEFRYTLDVDFADQSLLLRENIFKRSFTDTLKETYISALQFDPERSIYYNIIDSNGIYGVELSNSEVQNAKQRFINGKWNVISEY